MADLNVVTLKQSNFRDIPATLRAIANDIEAGRLGVVYDVALVAQGAEFNVYHAGAGDANTAHILLGCGMRKLEHAVIMQSGGYTLGE